MKTFFNLGWTLAVLLTPSAMADGVSGLLERAEKGEPAAQVELASIYLRGEGATAKDPDAAIKWLRQAAEQGAGDAQMMLGGIYISGKWVKKDSTEAAKWFMRSAQQGNPAAQAQAARMHMTGAGVPKDDVEAYKWANIAAAQGDSAGKKVLVFLEQRMTPKRISEGQARSHDFLEGKRLEKTLDPATEAIPAEASEPE